MPTIHQVFSAVANERTYQDQKWGPLAQHPHEVGGWLTIMRNLLAKADAAWSGKRGNAGALDEIRKVAAVATAAMEQHGLVTRDGQAIETQVPAIGENWPSQGGIYAGLMRGEKGQPDYHLILGSPAAEEIQYGGRGRQIAGADHEFDGAANTLALVEAGGFPAAEWAKALDMDGHADWYLPARRELALLYANLPDQFNKDWYWSSTQCAGDSLTAWCQHFSGGGQGNDDEGTELRARAVRRFTFTPSAI